MSTSPIESFLNKTRTDAALREQVNAIYEQADLAVAAELSRIATEVGLPFTAEEFLREEHSILPDEELGAVTGGARDFITPLATRPGIERLLKSKE